MMLIAIECWGCKCDTHLKELLDSLQIFLCMHFLKKRDKESISFTNAHKQFIYNFYIYIILVDIG